MPVMKSLEERKIKVLFELRGYRQIRKKKDENIVEFLVQDPKANQKILVWGILKERTVGVAFMNRIQKAMKEAKVTKGILVASGRFTHTVRKKSPALSIELLTKNFPAFNIFNHNLVPKHEILSDTEKEQLLELYRIKPFQFPEIKATDPTAKVIGAKPGDILRVIRTSPTAGKYISYRHVIP